MLTGGKFNVLWRQSSLFILKYQESENSVYSILCDLKLNAFKLSIGREWIWTSVLFPILNCLLTAKNDEPLAPSQSSVKLEVSFLSSLAWKTLVAHEFNFYFILTPAFLLQELDKYRVNMQSGDQQRLVIQLLRQHEQHSKQQKQHGNQKQQGQGPPTPPTIHAVRFRLPKESNTEQQGGLKAKLLPSSLRGNKSKEKSSTGTRGREGILSHFRWPRSRSADRLTTTSRDKQPEVKPEETNKRRTWFFTETSVWCVQSDFFSLFGEINSSK